MEVLKIFLRLTEVIIEDIKLGKGGKGINISLPSAFYERGNRLRDK